MSDSNDPDLAQGTVIRRTRSTIESPYFDLDSSMSVAQAVHAAGGDRCDWEQAAAALSLAPEGGGFRQRMLAAKAFGVIAYDRRMVTLTEIGRKAVDPSTEKQARVAAFMAVPLYRQMFDRLNGQKLPPNPAIEQMMASLGVSPKQCDRARQVFLRSARQASLNELATDRLTLPPTAMQPTHVAAPVHPATTQPSPARTAEPAAAHAGQHPFIVGLLQKLPEPDTEWSLRDRERWLRTASNIFDLMYLAPEGDIAASSPIPATPRRQEEEL